MFCPTRRATGNYAGPRSRTPSSITRTSYTIRSIFMPRIGAPPQLTNRRQRIRKMTHWPWGNPIDAHAHHQLLPQLRSWAPTKAATMRRCQEPTAPSCASSRPRSCPRAIPMPTLRQSTDADRRLVRRTASPLCPRWPTQAREFAMTWQPRRHGRTRKHNRRVSWFDRL